LGNYADLDDPMEILGTALAAGRQPPNWLDVNASKGQVVRNLESMNDGL